MLRAALANPLPFTRSDLEAEFLSLIDEWDMPRPLVNPNVAGHEVDFAWPEQRVSVESNERRPGRRRPRTKQR